MSGVSDRVANAGTLVVAMCAVTLTTIRVLGMGAGQTTQLPRETEVDEWAPYSASGIGHRVGPADAPVTIVEFGDYQCPVCRRFEPHLRAVRRKYADAVAVVYRHLPLDMHPLAYPAARAAECAGQQGRFWSYHEALYESEDWLVDPKATFLSLAREAGVDDVPAFEECFDSVGPVDAIERDIMAVGELGGRGTPTLLVNSRLLYGMRDSLELGSVVESFLQ